MTRLVTGFFAVAAFLLVVYWVVPGAVPPTMEAAAPVSPAPSAKTVSVAVPAAKPAPVAQQMPQPVVQAPAPPPGAVARASGCGDDPIRCVLEGKPLAMDPTEVTGSIVPSKSAARSAAAKVQKAAPKP